MEDRLNQLKKRLELEWRMLEIAEQHAKEKATDENIEMAKTQLTRWATLNRAIKFLTGESERWY